MKKINFFNNGNILYHTTDTVIPKVGEIVSINSNSAAAPKYTESDEVDVVIVGIPQPVVTS